MPFSSGPCDDRCGPMWLKTSFLTPLLGPSLFYIQGVLPPGITSQDV